MKPRTLVKLDALFEVALGLALLAGAGSGGLDGGDFPDPVGSALVVVAGALLLVIAAVLWRGAISLGLLAGANLVTAALVVIWLSAGSGFSTAGASLLVTTAAALAVLATAQLAMRHSTETPSASGGMF